MNLCVGCGGLANWCIVAGGRLGTMAHAYTHRYSKRTESTTSKASNGEQLQQPQTPTVREEDNPNLIVYKKVRMIICRAYPPAGTPIMNRYCVPVVLLLQATPAICTSTM